MLGGRFPRGLCYRLGRMTSPRYQILNLLAPAAYPRQDIQTVPRTPRVQPAALTYHIPTTSPHQLPSKPTPSTTSLSLHLPCRAYVVCSYNAGYSQRDAQFACLARGRARSLTYTRLIYWRNSGKNCFPAMLRWYWKERKRARCLRRLSIHVGGKWRGIIVKKEKKGKRGQRLVGKKMSPCWLCIKTQKWCTLRTTARPLNG